MIDVTRVKRDFPKVYKAFRASLSMGQHSKALKDVSQHVTDEMNEKLADGMLAFSKQKAYEVLDSYCVYLIIDYVMEGHTPKWYYILDAEEDKAAYKTRVEAEEAGIYKAYALLESKLS